MRLLLFSDLHADIAAAQRLAERAAGCDLMIGAGDFGNMRRQVEACMPALRSASKPILFVPGNNETTEQLERLCRDWPEARVLHGTGAAINGLEFFGLGAGVPVTPFGPLSFDLTEEQAAALLADCPEGGVLISHSPPKGAVDADSGGRSLGSVAVRDAILKKKPKLVVCGHIHASAGKQAILGASMVVNAGPRGVELEV